MMTQTKHNINLDQVETAVTNAFDELQAGLKSANLTPGERAEIRQDLQALEFKAYTIKIDLHLSTLTKSSPGMPARDMIILLLALLRPDASASMVQQVTKYILRELENDKLKAAA